MRCDEVRARIDEFVDGSLDPEERSRVAEHVAGCRRCAAELGELQDVLERVSALPAAIEPARDLWPGIASRLSPATVVRGRFGATGRRWLAVAATALMALAALVVAYTAGRQHGTTETVAVRAATPLAVPAGLDDAGFAGAEAEFRAARNQLLAALAERRESMSPETLRVVDENLRVIDGAIERISVALADDPLNPRLATQLTSAYRRQIALLQRANRLPAEI